MASNTNPDNLLMGAAVTALSSAMKKIQNNKNTIRTKPSDLYYYESDENCKSTTDLLFKSSLLSHSESGLSVNLETGSSSLSSNSPAGGRGNWAHPLEFILACVGYAVGLGNVWRFPYLVFRNGGGAFLVPFFLMVFVIGLPIFFAELFVGQYSGLGPIKAYHNLAPFFQGLGYCTLVVISFVTVYYMVVIAWIIFYFFASFTPRLLWGYCDNFFNTMYCYSSLEDNHCKLSNTNNPNDTIFWNRTCTSITDICRNHGLSGVNASYCLDDKSKELIPVRKIIKRILASEEYYYEYVLGIGDASWYNWGYPRWQLVLCLLLSWLIAFFCLIKGVKSAGKVVYFTALFPYVILTALLIRGATLDGAIEGILFYIQPDWSTLASPSVWGDAASQIFYSFGLACGSLVAFSSYNHFTHNCHTDAIVVSFTNVFTSVYAGFAVFSILGFMAKNIDVPVSEVIQSGPGLAFIAYPEAVLLMPLPHLWAVLFFLMMFVLGLGSQFGGIEAICTSLIDHWPHLSNHHWKVTAGVCAAGFLAGLTMVCDGGVYMFTLMEWHTASWAILLLGIGEVVIISWFYGVDKALNNLTDMGITFGGIMRKYWKSVWLVITPISSLAVFVFTLSGIAPTHFNNYKFPIWADLLGWLIGISTLAPFPIFLLYRGLNQKLRNESWFKPTNKWIPQEIISHETTPEDKSSKQNGIDNAAFEQS